MLGTNRALLALFSIILPLSVQAQPLTQPQIEYVTHLTNKAHSTVQQFVELVTNFIDLKHKKPLSTYASLVQKELQVLKQLIAELKVTIKQQPDSRYKVMLQDAKRLIETISKGLVAPIYKCLVGKKTRTQVSPEDRSEMLAAALKISVDEFNATSLKEIIVQFQKLYTYLTNFGLMSIAETVKNVVDLLEQSQSAQQQALSEDQKKVIKSAILLKLQLDS